MIFLGFINFFVKVLWIYSIFIWLVVITFTSPLKVKIPTLLGFGLMATKKSLVIMQSFCFHVSFALICCLVAFAFSTSLILSLSVLTCYCSPSSWTMFCRLPWMHSKSCFNSYPSLRNLHPLQNSLYNLTTFLNFVKNIAPSSWTFVHFLFNLSKEPNIHFPIEVLWTILAISNTQLTRWWFDLIPSPFTK